MLGGVLLFEIHLAEPFFIVKLRVIECSRLQAKSSSALINQVYKNLPLFLQITR